MSDHNTQPTSSIATSFFNAISTAYATAKAMVEAIHPQLADDWDDDVAFSTTETVTKDVQPPSISPSKPQNGQTPNTETPDVQTGPVLQPTPLPTETTPVTSSGPKVDEQPVKVSEEITRIRKEAKAFREELGKYRKQLKQGGRAAFDIAKKPNFVTAEQDLSEALQARDEEAAAQGLVDYKKQGELTKTRGVELQKLARSLDGPLTEVEAAQMGSEGDDMKSLRQGFADKDEEVDDYLEKFSESEMEVVGPLMAARRPTLVKNIRQAIKDGDAGGGKTLLQDYTDAFADLKRELTPLLQEQKKWRNKLHNTDVGFLQDLAQVTKDYEKATADCETAYSTVNSALNKNDPNRGQLGVLAKTFRDCHRNEILQFKSYPAELVELSAGAATEKGSLLWFAAIEGQITALAAPPIPTLPTPEELEWQAVAADVILGWNAFKGSKFSFSLRGPSMPTNLRTDAVQTVYFVAGKSYRIGGKVYSVENSDSGGLGLKTSFPAKFQGYNANGKWVQSFIYHLMPTH